MNHKIIIEVDHNLREGEILQYSGGIIRSVKIHELLPDVIVAENKLKDLELAFKGALSRIERLESQVKELRGED